MEGEGIFPPLFIYLGVWSLREQPLGYGRDLQGAVRSHRRRQGVKSHEESKSKNAVRLCTLLVECFFLYAFVWLHFTPSWLYGEYFFAHRDYAGFVSLLLFYGARSLGKYPSLYAGNMFYHFQEMHVKSQT